MRVLRGISISPSSGSSWPIITFIRVDLPAPLRPIRPTRLFGGKVAVARSRIVRPPRRTVIPLIFSMTGHYHAAQHFPKGQFHIPLPRAGGEKKLRDAVVEQATFGAQGGTVGCRRQRAGDIGDQAGDLARVDQALEQRGSAGGGEEFSLDLRHRRVRIACLAAQERLDPF